jgi:hypothetical protein
MAYQQKHINHPMSFLETKRRQGGRYGYEYFDMDGTSWPVFSDFYGPGSRHFCSADNRLGAVYKAANRHRHASVCRSGRLSGSRRVSSFSAGCAMGHASPVADADPVADSNLRPKGSFADAMACLRRWLWRERIKLMFGNSAVHDKKSRFLLETLSPAA